VIGGDRTLTGYGGGIAIKAALLAHEGVLPKDLASRADRRTKIDLTHLCHLALRNGLRSI
jgi:hypothetical protein